MDIARLQGTGMNDGTFANAFRSAPINAIILMEDADCMFPARNTDGLIAAVAAETPVIEIAPATPTRPTYRLTLSGILNALDGLASVEGRIFIMTTNYSEKLDPAIVRPGRCDGKVLVSYAYASPKQMVKLFTKFYGNEEEASGQQFAQSMEGVQVSMAALQGHFLIHTTSRLALTHKVLDTLDQ